MPISYLKANTADVVRKLSEDRGPVVITQNDEAKAVIQDIASFEQHLNRGHYPPELAAVGIKQFRGIHFNRIAPSIKLLGVPHCRR